MLRFFEYTLSGWLYFVWLVLMLIFSLACLGVIGEKVSKKKEKERLEKRRLAAEEEYKKAQELVERQAQMQGIEEYNPMADLPVTSIPGVVKSSVEEVSQPAEAKPEQEVVVLEPAPTNDAEPANGESAPVNNSNVTPQPAGQNAPAPVDNTSEDSIKKDDVPAVLVINSDGTSGS